jgi:hypothetical protein
VQKIIFVYPLTAVKFGITIEFESGDRINITPKEKSCAPRQSRSGLFFLKMALWLAPAGQPPQVAN